MEASLLGEVPSDSADVCVQYVYFCKLNKAHALCFLSFAVYNHLKRHLVQLCSWAGIVVTIFMQKLIRIGIRLFARVHL